MWYKQIRARIEKSKTSTYRTKDGEVVTTSKTFKALPLSAHKEINSITETENKLRFIEFAGRNHDTMTKVQERSADLGLKILNVPIGNTTGLLERTQDHIGFRDFGGGAGGHRGGISNPMWMTGINGSDPATMGRVNANLYISPGEAASIVSQRGLPEVILNKKAKSMLLNGVEITNPCLTEEQIERVHDRMIQTDFAKFISDGIKDALTYSGSILFPFFKNDSPLSMTLPTEVLAKHGIIRKNCIDRWVELDRWNTTHFPNWNPTAEDFRKPRYFYVPFLGTDIHSSRIARIVTAPQPGYWGVMLNMGWGVSDMVAWIESVFNYYNVMQAIPTMIQQMSLLARTFNVDAVGAMEGVFMLDEIIKKTEINVRQASALNPVTMDVIGDLKSIQRDFGEVPQLCRLIRQDLAAKAGLLEQSLFTVDPKGMGGGDNIAPWTRQEETNRFMYTDVQQQLKQVTKLQVIDALGLDRDIIKALPYTQIRFDNQKVTDVEDRVEVIKATTKGFFDTTAAGMPIAAAAQMMEQLSGGLFKIDAELNEQLEEQQDLTQEMEQEKHDAEIKAMLAPPASAGGAAPKKASSSKKEGGNSYEDPLDQKKSERVRKGGSRRQGLQKARNSHSNKKV